MLIKRTNVRPAAAASRPRCRIAIRRPRPPQLPAPLRPRRRRPRRARRAAARQRAQGQGRPAAARRRASHHPQEHLHALLGRLHGHRRSRQRRVDRPGARLGFADQPRLALRQGRGGARTRARRSPPEISDEARQRPLDADLLGAGDQRDRRQAHGHPREVRTGFGLLARLRQVLQRRRLSLSASSRRSGAPTTSTIRRASAIPPPSPA